MRNAIILSLLCAGSLFAESPVVNSQCPSNTIYSGITAPGVEVDLGRSWTQYTNGTASFVQWRVGLCKYVDVRFNKDMATIQSATSIGSSTIGVQASWGHDWKKAILLGTFQISDTFFVDTNCGVLKNTTTDKSTSIFAADFYYSKDKWAYGIEAVVNKEEQKSLTSMVWCQYLINNRIGIWGGVNRELHLEEKSTTVTVGTSIRFF